MGAHFWHKYKIKEGFFSPNIVELSQKQQKKNVCVQEANLGKVAKSLYRSDQGKYFFF